MKFDHPAGQNPIDQGKVVGRATPRIDGPLKVSGTAPYAYERHDVAPNQAYGFVLGSAIARGQLRSINVADAKAAPGVVTVVTALDSVPLARGKQNTARLFGGPDIEHYHQAIAIVVAETFEEARAAAALIRVDYARGPGKYDLAAEAPHAPITGGSSGEGGVALVKREARAGGVGGVGELAAEETVLPVHVAE